MSLKHALPQRGVAAHRGGPAEGRPENTCAAFRHAVSLGVHQVELDVRCTADGEVVVMHDDSVDRTTDGSGRVSDLTLAALRELDAGGSTIYRGERVPTLAEALACMPDDVWVNVQIKRGEPIAAAVARCVHEAGREDQTLLACGNAAAREAREVHPEIRICNLVRQANREDYVEHAIATRADFLQFHHLRGPLELPLVERAHANGIRVNYFCAPDVADAELDALFGAGVDFVLLDDLGRGLRSASRFGIEPLRYPGPEAGSGSAGS